ncbi:histone-fold-containing protein [Mycena albidolilacea]|uniref:Histone-fold-containing protein n=1 Tax=Mycena albidolilacea TaxID=1033008 RepID=A0AAD6YXH4_9AGAR|nr:histone-fold-containing protein [Mycena albidolilacea]
MLSGSTLALRRCSYTFDDGAYRVFPMSCTMVGTRSSYATKAHREALSSHAEFVKFELTLFKISHDISSLSTTTTLLLRFQHGAKQGKQPAIRFPCMTPSPCVELPPKPRRVRSCTYVMREIHQYQQTNGTLLPKTLFQRLVKEIADNHQYLVSVFEDTKCAAAHAHRETIQIKDMALALRVCGDRF